MLTEARDLGERARRHRDPRRGDGVAGRRPSSRSAISSRPGARSPRCSRPPSRPRQPFMLHVAEHYGSAIALCDGRLDEAEAPAERSHEWSRLLTGRDASGVYGIQMFSIRREQGRLAELAPVIRILAGDGRRGGPWRPGLVALLAELGMDDGGAAGARAGRAPTGSTRFRESLWLASLTYLDRRLRRARRRGRRRRCLSRARAARRDERDDRPPGRLLRRGRPLPRACSPRPSASGSAREAHFERALELNRRMGATTWLAHTAYEYGRLLLARGAASRDRAAALLGEAAALAERIGMPALLGRIRALGTAAPAAAPPGRALAARGRDPAPRRPRASATARSAPTLFDQRAHGRQPHPQHPAQDRLREPHRGRLLRAPARPRRSALSDRATIQAMPLYMIERTLRRAARPRRATTSS